MEHGIKHGEDSGSLGENVHMKWNHELARTFRNYCDGVHRIRQEQFRDVLWDKVFQIIAFPLCSIMPGFGVRDEEREFLRECTILTRKESKASSEMMRDTLEQWESETDNRIYLITSSYWSPLYAPGRNRYTLTNIDVKETPRFIVGDKLWLDFCSEGNKANPDLVGAYKQKLIQDDDNEALDPKLSAKLSEFRETIEQVKNFWGYERNGASSMHQRSLWNLFLRITEQCQDEQNFLGWTLNAFVAEKSRWKSIVEIRIGVADGKERFYTEEVRKWFEANYSLTSRKLVAEMGGKPKLHELIWECPLEIPFDVVETIREDDHFRTIGKWLYAVIEGRQDAREPTRVAGNFTELVTELVRKLSEYPQLRSFLAYVRAYVRTNFGVSGEEGTPDPLTNHAALVMVGGVLLFLYPFIKSQDEGKLSDECLSLHLFPMELAETCIWNVVAKRPIGKDGWGPFVSMADKLFTRPLTEDWVQLHRKQAREIEARWYGEAIAHELRVVALAAQNDAFTLKRYFQQCPSLDPDQKNIGTSSKKQSVNDLLDTLMALGKYADESIDYLYSMKEEADTKLERMSLSDIYDDNIEDKIYSLSYGKLKKRFRTDLKFGRDTLPSLCPVQWRLNDQESSVIFAPRIGVEIALINLIGNAVFHSAVHVIANELSEASVTVSLEETEEDSWKLKICNPGSLPPLMINFVGNKLDEIPPGAVGLSIVQHIAEQYGWELQYNEEESRENQQVVFNLTITSVKEA